MSEPAAAIVSCSAIPPPNEESGEAGSVTTVTFVETDGRTRVVVHDLYPSKAALDEAIASGSTGAYPEQFAELDGLLAAAPEQSAKAGS
jgi:hypothetical protein